MAAQRRIRRAVHAVHRWGTDAPGLAHACFHSGRGAHLAGRTRRLRGHRPRTAPNRCASAAVFLGRGGMASSGGRGLVHPAPRFGAVQHCDTLRGGADRPDDHRSRRAGDAADAWLLWLHLHRNDRARLRAGPVAYAFGRCAVDAGRTAAARAAGVRRRRAARRSNIHLLSRCIRWCERAAVACRARREAGRPPPRPAPAKQARVQGGTSSQ